MYKTKSLRIVVLLLLSSCEVTDLWAPILYQHSELPDTYKPELFAFEKILKQDTVRILCAGTSLTYGMTTEGARSEYPWPRVLQDLLSQHWPNILFSIENDGIGGVQSRGLYMHLAEKNLSLYDLIFIEIGTNDAFHEISLAAYAISLDNMIKLSESPSNSIVMIAPPPALSQLSKPLIEYTRIMANVSAKYKLGFINMNRRIGNRLDEMSQPSYLYQDGLHFTTQGYHIFAENVFNWLENSYPKEQEH
jgi:lysophospholipase L1-like esterase